MVNKWLRFFETIYGLYIVLSSMENILCFADDDEDANDCILRGHILQSRVLKIDALIDEIEALWEARLVRTAANNGDPYVLITHSDIKDLVDNSLPIMHFKLDLGDTDFDVTPEIFMAVRDNMETPENQISVPINQTQAKRLVTLIEKY